MKYFKDKYVLPTMFIYNTDEGGGTLTMILECIYLLDSQCVPVVSLLQLQE